MAIAAKPKRTTPVDQINPVITDEQKAMNFIRQGGSVAQPTTETDDEKMVGVIVRMYPDMKQEVDSHIKALPKRSRPSRNAWILQAIEEKLKRDSKKIA